MRLPAFVAAQLENVPRFSVTYLFWIDIGEIETTRTRPNPSRHASDQGDRGTGILASRSYGSDGPQRKVSPLTQLKTPAALFLDEKSPDTGPRSAADFGATRAS